MNSGQHLSAYLRPTAFIDAEHPAVRACAEARSRGAATDSQRAAALFRFVRDHIRYEFAARFRPEQYVASKILDQGRGFCVQKAVLLCALARASGIPTALVLSDLRDHTLPRPIVRAMGTDVLYHHGLNAFYLGSRWLRADASLSPDVMEKGRYRPVEFDGSSEALLASTALDGRPHAEYLRFHGRLHELPFPEMLEAFARGYRNADLAALARLGYRVET